MAALFCYNNAEICSTLGVVPPLKPIRLYKVQQKTSQSFCSKSNLTVNVIINRMTLLG